MRSKLILPILLSLLGIILIVGVTLKGGTMAQETKTNSRKAEAVLAGGCFWCVESDMQKLDGVMEAVSGYTGGTIPNPTYDNYHDDIPGKTPHVEAVRIIYDPSVISYEELLDFYFRHIDPTDGSGQFCDRGAAYRPVIFVRNEEERRIAEEKKRLAAKALDRSIEVEILDASAFWPAEEYHQEYAEKNPIRYNFYRWRCGRDQRIEEIWGKE